MASIRVKALGKAYKRYPNRWSRLAEWCLPWVRSRHALNWVLREVSFDVSPGEAIGIVGMNGAGKSTLLKMLTGTTRPTRGEIKITGQVASLLELGMGFHPEFSGRQNVMMAGQLLGYTRQELHRLMPEIEAFAEIGEYIDQPVRLYSSGMQMRLAFAVATARRPDVFIVDEALSVGDAYFQHKSFDRIRQYREQGTTLLLVSHDKSAILAICDRALLLHQGRLLMTGEPESVMDFYNALLADPEQHHVVQQRQSDGKMQTRSGTGEASVVEVMLLNAEGQAVECVDVGQQVTLQLKVQVYADLDRLVLGYGIRDCHGQVMYGTNTELTEQVLEGVCAGQCVVFKVTFPASLGPGIYSVQTALTSASVHLHRNYEWCDRALLFEVVNRGYNAFEGRCWLQPEIQVMSDR